MGNQAASRDSLQPKHQLKRTFVFPQLMRLILGMNDQESIGIVADAGWAIELAFAAAVGE